MPFKISKNSPLIFISLLVLLIFCWIEVDLYAPAFPQLRRFFQTTEEMIQMTLSLNFLGYFTASLMVGPLGDRYGRRPVILAGSALATFGILLFLPESHPAENRLPFSLGLLGENYGALLRSRFFLTTVFGLVFLATPYFVFIATIPFLFLETLRLPMSQYVYFQGVVVGLFALLSLMVPSLVGKVDSRKMTLGSIYLSLSASFLLCLHALFLPDGAMAITLLMCLFVMGTVWPCSCIFTVVFEAFPGLKGSACAMFSSIRMIVMASAIALSGHLYNDTFKWVGVLMFIQVLTGFHLLLYAQRMGGFQVGKESLPMH